MNDRLTNRQARRRSPRSRLVLALGLVAAALLVAGTAMAATPRTPAPDAAPTPAVTAQPTPAPAATPPAVQYFTGGAPGAGPGGPVKK